MVDMFEEGRRERGLTRSEGLWPAGFAPWQLLSDILPRERATPTVEVAEEDDALIVRAELPGIRSEDLDVWLSDDAVTLQGERRAERRSEGQGYFRTERHYGKFRRVVALPMAVDSDQAEASFDDGVLAIRAPKRDPRQGRWGRRIDLQ